MDLRPLPGAISSWRALSGRAKARGEEVTAGFSRNVENWSPRASLAMTCDIRISALVAEVVERVGKGHGSEG